jgi:hypothetical protein
MTFKFSNNSLKQLEGVKPALVAVVKRALELSEVDFSVIEGLRTVERQKKLVASGASQTMNSKHITGDAVDLFPVGSTWKKEEFFPVAHAIYAAAQELNTPIRWGGNFTVSASLTYPGLRKTAGFLDCPHFELA